MIRTLAALRLSAALLVPSIAVADHRPRHGGPAQEFFQQDELEPDHGKAQPGEAISGAAQSGDFEELNEPVGC